MLGRELKGMKNFNKFSIHRIFAHQIVHSQGKHSLRKVSYQICCQIFVCSINLDKNLTVSSKFYYVSADVDLQAYSQTKYANNIDKICICCINFTLICGGEILYWTCCYLLVLFLSKFSLSATQPKHN